MKNKRWLTAILIISVLVIAFFWSGDYQKGTNRVAEVSPESQSISETVPSVSDENTSNNGTEQSPAPEGNQQLEPSQEVEASQAREPSPEPEPSQAPEPSPKSEGSQEATKPDKPSETEKPAGQSEKKPEANSSNSQPKPDKYLTDPVPNGKPKPVEWQDTEIDKSTKLSITLSVTCTTILDNMNIFNKDKLEVLPANGIIYKTQTVTFYEGESVFDVLLREMKKNKIHMEFEMTPIYNSNYIEGINNIYEFDCGELSGWMFKVNGWFPNYGSSRYLLKDGDIVEWVYTCDLGRDVGGDTAAGGENK